MSRVDGDDREAASTDARASDASEAPRTTDALIRKHGESTDAAFGHRREGGRMTARELTWKLTRLEKCADALRRRGKEVSAKLEQQMAYVRDAAGVAAREERRGRERASMEFETMAVRAERSPLGKARSGGGERRVSVDFERFAHAREATPSGRRASEVDDAAAAVARTLDAINHEHGLGGDIKRQWSEVGVRSNGQRQLDAALGRESEPKPRRGDEQTYYRRATRTTTNAIGRLFGLSSKESDEKNDRGGATQSDDKPPAKRRASSRGKKTEPIMVDLLESEEERGEDDLETSTKVLDSSDAVTASGDELRRSTRSSRYRSLQTELGNLSTMYPDAKVKGAVQITLGDLENLKDGSMLNDQCVDFFLKYVQIETIGKQFPDVLSKVHFFNSFFYQKLAQRNDLESGVDAATASHARVKGWTKGVDVFEKEFLLIPVHSGLHWSLAIVCYAGFDQSERDPMILHMDSLTQSGGHNSEMVAKNVRRYLNKEWVARGKGDEEDKFTTKTLPCLRPNVPRQQNGCDCGVFILAFVEKFLTEKPQILEESQVRLATQRRVFGTTDTDVFLRKNWFPNECVDELRIKLTALIIDCVAASLEDNDLSKITLKEARNHHLKELDHRQLMTKRAESRAEKERHQRIEAKEEQARLKLKAQTLDSNDEKKKDANAAQAENDEDEDFNIGIVEDHERSRSQLRTYTKTTQSTFLGSNWNRANDKTSAGGSSKSVVAFSGQSYRVGSYNSSVKPAMPKPGGAGSSASDLIKRHNRSQARLTEERLSERKETQQKIQQYTSSGGTGDENGDPKPKAKNESTLLDRLSRMRTANRNQTEVENT